MLRRVTIVFLPPVLLMADNSWDSSSPIQPIPLSFEQNLEKIWLGKKLFNDPQLSHNNTFSCANCHQLEQGGDDGLASSMSINNSQTVMNTPTVFNARFNYKLTWDGLYKTLEEQAEGDILYSDHGSSNWSEVIDKLSANSEYQEAFNKIYQKGINKESILDAIASFERSLITPNSRFDQYIRGNINAITENEKTGYKYFQEYGCVACHQGVNAGGNVYQKLGLFDDYFESRGNISTADYGLFNITGKEEDKFIFRVPGLRNIEVTGPYLHDGSIKDLKKVVKIMARYQLGTSIPDDKLDHIVSFLKTLTGEYQGKLLVDHQ